MAADFTSEERDLLALNLVPGLGPRLTAALLEQFGSATAVLQATASQLMEVPHVGPKIAHDLSLSPATVRSHVRNAMVKTGTHTRAQLVALVLGDSLAAG